MVIGRTARNRAEKNAKRRKALSIVWSTVLTVLVVCPVLNGQTAPAEQKDPGKLHAGIEIDPEGMKAAVIRVFSGEQAGAEIVYTEVISKPLIRDKSGRLATENIKAVGRSALALYNQLQKKFQVPQQNIYLVGRNELKAENLDELARELKTSTGKTITFLNLESEARMNVIGVIPKRYREQTTSFDNRSQSVLIDIGGEKTIGGYLQTRNNLLGNPYYDFVAVGMPIGVSVFAETVLQAAGENAGVKEIAASAGRLSKETLVPVLRKESEQRPGLSHRKKVYLKGAIVQALATLLHPEDRRAYLTITPEDIELFHQRAVNAPQSLLKPNLSQIRNRDAREEVEREVETLRSFFTPARLIAGAEILKAIASEYDLRDGDKKILYARFSNLSLVFSYVRLQADNGPQP